MAPQPDGPADALLVIEIGNSHVALARLAGAEVRSVQRCLPDELDELRAALEPAWESLPEDADRQVAIGSVVPAVLDRVVMLVHEELRRPPIVIGRDTRLPLSMAIERVETIGVDRVCAAAAAFERFAQACAVASFGTATTIDCVNGEGVFMGGAILPGLNMQASALHERTAQLPLVRPHAGVTTYGSTTEEAINNGIVLGAIGALREIVERYATQLTRWPKLVVTGGMSPLVADACEFVDAVEPHLVVEGIALAARRFRSSPSGT